MSLAAHRHCSVLLPRKRPKPQNIEPASKSQETFDFQWGAKKFKLNVRGYQTAPTLEMTKKYFLGLVGTDYGRKRTQTDQNRSEMARAFDPGSLGAGFGPSAERLWPKSTPNRPEDDVWVLRVGVVLWPLMTGGLRWGKSSVPSDGSGERAQGQIEELPPPSALLRSIEVKRPQSATKDLHEPSVTTSTLSEPYLVSV